MLSQISFTFGSMPVLLEIIKKHPDRDFRLLQATGDNSKLALFDLSGKPTIFNSPITLETLYSVGNDKFKGILHFESFELDNIYNEEDDRQFRVDRIDSSIWYN